MTLDVATPPLHSNRVQAWVYALMPHHYGTHKFWELYKNKFEVYRERPSFQAVKEATEELNRVSSKLLTELESHRQLLCRKYDIPAAPIPQAKGHSTDAFSV